MEFRGPATPRSASLNRLGRSLQHFISIVAGLRKRGVGFRLRHEALGSVSVAL
ncbi:hypothetical protein ACTMTI_43090 [Nonomuraea sp. H19]|uniref:hypothetical protein n=1 Tax=Nonomuraea sp. H19 TaxID=3452206 RepID=UPI003F89D8A9